MLVNAFCIKRFGLLWILVLTQLSLNRLVKLPENVLCRVKPDQTNSGIVDIEDHVNRQRNGRSINCTVKDVPVSRSCHPVAGEQ